MVENALKFVNSNRGTESDNGRVFRVSAYYQRNAGYFPDFDKDLTTHLMTYLEGDEHVELQKANRIKPDIKDWTIYGMLVQYAG